MECRARLSSTMLLQGDGGGFPLLARPMPGEAKTHATWVAYNVTRTRMPASSKRDDVPYNPDCKGQECERSSRRMVPGNR